MKHTKKIWKIMKDAENDEKKVGVRGWPSLFSKNETNEKPPYDGHQTIVITVVWWHDDHQTLGIPSGNFILSLRYPMLMER